MDQSSGHGCMREGALNINNMSVRYGGCQEKLRETKIRDVGTYTLEYLKLVISNQWCLKTMTMVHFICQQ